MKETSELNTKPIVSDDDEKHYSGIAKQPLARRWLKRRLRSEMRRATASGPGETREMHKRRAAEIRQLLEPKGGA